MNCDTAFDLMTDAHGSRSGALAEHFEACPRCRRMQETLAPALDFLSEETALSDSLPDQETAQSVNSGVPFVTAEAVQIARQVATGLTARSEMPRIRAARVAARTARYAAVFAAGLMLAVILFSQRDRGAIPEGTCTRREASEDNSSRTPEQVAALARSCAVCHRATSAAGDDQSLNHPARGPASWDWLLPLLEVPTPAAIERPLSDAGQMIATATCRARHFTHQA